MAPYKQERLLLMEYEEEKMYHLDLGDGDIQRAFYYRDGEGGFFGLRDMFGFIDESDIGFLAEVITNE